VRRLAEQFGARLVNLNDEPGVEVKLTTSKARVARICLETDFIIALPKIKTHAEAGMSLACKLLVGCVVGQDKKRVHDDLIPNILRLNEIIKPDLYIVDGLIAMEGNGPGDGHPRRLDVLLAGTDPFLIDLVGARLVGFELEEIPHLQLARAKGHISPEDWQTAQALEPIAHIEKPPPRKLATRILGHNIFAGLRDATRPLHSARVIQQLLYRTGIIQDVYEVEDAHLDPFTLDREACTECGACLSFCPLELPITAPDFDFNSGQCIGCLVCAFVCPEGAIPLIGELGYLAAHVERFGEEMRQLGREEASRLRQEPEAERAAA
jgi:ferredoxin